MCPDRVVDVRRLRADEAALFRTLPRRALADAPDALAHTYDDVRTRPDVYCEEMTRSVTDPDRHAMFVAEDGSGPIGRMWVAPGGRRDRLPSSVGLKTIEMRLALPARTP